MLIRAGLLLDVNNLYYSIQRKFGKGPKLMVVEYAKYIEKVLGFTLVHKIAYSRQPAEQAVGFTTMLRNEGWETHFGNTSWAVAMALRATDIADNIDAFVLGTSFEELGRTLEWMKKRGKLTHCFACEIPDFFKTLATCTEVTEALLNNAPSKTA